MRNKIAIGLGLMLSLTASVSFADALGGSIGEINLHTPFTMPLQGKLAMGPGKYYTLTCQLNNIHNAKNLKAVVELEKGSLFPASFQSSVSMGSQPVTRIGYRKLEVPLADGMNTLVINHIHPGSTTNTTTEEYETTVPDTRPIDNPDHRWYHYFMWWGPKAKIEQPYDKPVTKSRPKVTIDYDQLIFSAINASGEELGSGYRLENCDYTAEDENSSPSPTTNTTSPAVETQSPVAEAPLPVIEVQPPAIIEVQPPITEGQP